MKAAPVGDYQRVYGVAVDVRGMAFEAFIKRKKNSHYADEAEQAIAFTLLKEAGMPNRHGTDDAVLKLKDAVPIPARFGDRSGIAVQLRLTDDGTSYPVASSSSPPRRSHPRASSTSCSLCTTRPTSWLSRHCASTGV